MTSLEPGVPVGVVGAGTMGAGIAQVAGIAGHPVYLYDSSAGAAQRAVAGIEQRLRHLVDKGRLSTDEATATVSRIQAVGTVADLSRCGLVVEAIAEDLVAKQELFAELESVCESSAILATNTSSLSVTAVAENLRVPERVAGLHFFNPAPVLPLVEVIAGAATGDKVLDSLVQTARAWGKEPVRATSTPGFIVNRVARPFYAEALRLVAAGVADPATVDALIREAGGFRMGPCELIDLVGADVNLAVTRSVWEAFGQDPRFEPSPLQERMVAEGRLGRKVGHGFYTGTGADSARAVGHPATASAGPRPERVMVYGQAGPLSGLLPRLEAGGVRVVTTPDGGPLRLCPSPDVAVRVTTGGTAAEASADAGETIVLVDLALDYATATRVAVAAAPDAPPAAVNAAIGVLQAAGLSVTVVPDSPGLVVARTVAMLAAFAADAVDAGVATADDVDTAMRLGVNYPRGPLAWGDAMGWGWVAGVLDALAAHEDPDRYRVSGRLRDRIEASDG